MTRQSLVVSVANSKGGVGKSTLATNLAAVAAGEGRAVLLVDTDPQASSTLFAATRGAELPPIRVIQLTKPILHREIPKLAEPYDLVVLDTGGRETATFRSAIAASSLILVPVTPSAYDIWASEDTFSIIDEFVHTHDIATRVVLNQVIAGTRVASEALTALAEMTADQEVTVLATRLHARVAWKVACSQGLAVTEYEPRGAAAEELRALWRELALFDAPP